MMEAYSFTLSEDEGLRTGLTEGIGMTSFPVVKPMLRQAQYERGGKTTHSKICRCCVCRSIPL